jgi:hypothetical protein
VTRADKWLTMNLAFSWKWWLILPFLLLLGACAEEEEEVALLPPDPPQPSWGPVDEPDLPIPSWMNPDSLIRQWTDTFVAGIRTDTSDGRENFVFFPERFSPLDSITYTIEDGQITAMWGRFSPPAQELFLEYYFLNGDLRYIRHREWNLRPENSGAREMNFFLREGELFFVRDRKTVLEIGEPPARIAFHRLRPSQRPREDLVAEMEAHRSYVLDKVAEDLEKRRR